MRKYRGKEMMSDIFMYDYKRLCRGTFWKIIMKYFVVTFFCKCNSLKNRLKQFLN